jgi:HTH-type transcriptional repressor purR
MMTLAKIAKEIGVGKSTVSLVLNGRAKEMRISDNTVRRVRDYCEKMNYLPNIHARRMCQDVVKSIMVFLNVHNAFLSESSFADYNVNLIMGGITEVADAAGFSTIIRLYRTDMNEQLIFNSFRNHDIDGMVYYGMSMPPHWLAILKREKRRVVGIGIEPGEIPCVNIDNYKISRSLTRLLLEKKRRKFFYLAGTDESYPGRERYRGFLDELKEAGIPFNEDKNCYQCQFQEDLAGEAVRKILAASMRPDAIMCANDKMALGAIRALREAGFSVPNEVSVAGGDNIELAAYVTPGLTTFENQAARQGAEACRLLLDMINGNKRPDQLISSQLVMRESV